jgi:hypothetical protein
MLITLNAWFESDSANSIYDEYTEYAREKKREDEKIGYEKIEDEKISFINDLEWKV